MFLFSLCSTITGRQPFRVISQDANCLLKSVKELGLVLALQFCLEFQLERGLFAALVVS